MPSRSANSGNNNNNNNHGREQCNANNRAGSGSNNRNNIRTNEGDAGMHSALRYAVSCAKPSATLAGNLGRIDLSRLTEPLRRSLHNILLIWTSPTTTAEAQNQASVAIDRFVSRSQAAAGNAPRKSSH